MNASQIRALRERLNVTQATMGKLIGLSLRGYTKLETGEQQIRRMHVLAIERMMLAAAAQREDVTLLPASVRRDMGKVLAR